MNLLKPQIYFAPGGDSPVSSTVSISVKQTQETLRLGAKFLKPLRKDRRFSISNGDIYVPTHGNDRPRKIDVARENEASGITQIKNSLLRELTILIKGEKDEIIAQDQNVKRLARLLLRIAGNKEYRFFLRDLTLWYSNEISDVEGIGANYDTSSEGIMKEIYEKIIQKLDFTSDEIDTVLGFSWEWKSTFKHATYGCRMWMIVTCIINMIDLEKE